MELDVARIPSDAIGVDLPDDLTFEQYLALAEHAQLSWQRMRWVIGDILAFGERKFTEWDQAIRFTGKENETIRKYMQVAQAIPRDKRKDNLTWTHHFHVAFVPEPLRYDLLEEAESEGLRTHELKARVKEKTALVINNQLRVIDGGLQEPHTAPEPLDGPNIVAPTPETLSARINALTHAICALPANADLYPHLDEDVDLFYLQSAQHRLDRIHEHVTRQRAQESATPELTLPRETADPAEPVADAVSGSADLTLPACLDRKTNGLGQGNA